MDPDKQAREECATSLKRMQEFDVQSLVREKDLGAALNFRDVVAPAQRLVDLYRRLSPAALQDLPAQQLQQVQNQANADYQIFSQILGFETTQSNPHEVRQQLLQKVTAAYQPAFNVLHPLVSYSLHRSADFQRLDQDARATIQGIQDRSEALTADLERSKKAAESVLDEVRKVAAEAGVSQQAYHFQQAAQGHAARAEEWRSLTVKFAWALGAFAGVSFFIHKIPWLAPNTTYDTVQLAVSKVLVFATLSYMLYLAAKNFLSHEHNAIVNRHRQDALMTYKALVDAAGNAANRDVVLTYAAACIFSPQSTGYSGDGGEGPKSVVELLTRSLAGSE